MIHCPHGRCGACATPGASVTAGGGAGRGAGGSARRRWAVPRACRRRSRAPRHGHRPRRPPGAPRRWSTRCTAGRGCRRRCAGSGPRSAPSHCASVSTVSPSVLTNQLTAVRPRGGGVRSSVWVSQSVTSCCWSGSPTYRVPITTVPVRTMSGKGAVVIAVSLGREGRSGPDDDAVVGGLGGQLFYRSPVQARGAGGSSCHATHSASLCRSAGTQAGWLRRALAANRDDRVEPGEAAPGSLHPVAQVLGTDPGEPRMVPPRARMPLAVSRSG